MKRTCEKISQLASERLERNLSLKESLRIRFHFLMCHACKHYAANITKLHHALRSKLRNSATSVSLPQDKRELIHENLSKLNRKN